jgi:hypothetical protein
MSKSDNNSEETLSKTHEEYINELEEIAQKAYDPNVDVFSKETEGTSLEN